MFAQFYAEMPWTELPQVALLIFFVTFASVIVRMTLFARRGELQALARMPLDDGQAPDARPAGQAAEVRP